MRGLSLVAASGSHFSSRCAGLSLLRPLLLRSTGSRRAGSVVVAHGPSCSAACGIFPGQGSNPCPLHWQADSQPLRHQGSPNWHFLNFFQMSYSFLILLWYLITYYSTYHTLLGKKKLFSVSVSHSSHVGSLGIYIYPQGISIWIRLGSGNIKKEHHRVITLKNFPVEKMRQKCTLMYSFRTTNTCNILCVLLLHWKSQTIWKNILIILKARTDHLMQSCKMSYS